MLNLLSINEKSQSLRLKAIVRLEVPLQECSPSQQLWIETRYDKRPIWDDELSVSKKNSNLSMSVLGPRMTLS